MNRHYIVINPVKNLLEELEGSLTLPEKWKGQDMDHIMKESKKRYFKNKKT